MNPQKVNLDLIVELLAHLGACRPLACLRLPWRSFLPVAGAAGVPVVLLLTFLLLLSSVCFLTLQTEAPSSETLKERC